MMRRVDRTGLVERLILAVPLFVMSACAHSPEIAQSTRLERVQSAVNTWGGQEHVRPEWEETHRVSAPDPAAHSDANDNEVIRDLAAVDGPSDDGLGWCTGGDPVVEGVEPQSELERSRPRSNIFDPYLSRDEQARLAAADALFVVWCGPPGCHGRIVRCDEGTCQVLGEQNLNCNITTY